MGPQQCQGLGPLLSSPLGAGQIDLHLDVIALTVSPGPGGLLARERLDELTSDHGKLRPGAKLQVDRCFD